MDGLEERPVWDRTRSAPEVPRSGDAGHDPTWTLVFDGYDPHDEGRREALCVLGNGCFATRGAAAESFADDVHYPGTYIAGGYNRLASQVAGRTVVNEDLVNLPNWLPVNFRPREGSWLRWGEAEVLDYRMELRLSQGILVRLYRVQDGEGRITDVRDERLVHMRKSALAALSYTFTPVNWSGEAEVGSWLDGSVENRGVARYRELASKHLEVLEKGPSGEEGVCLRARTVQSRLEVGLAARTRVYAGGERVDSLTRDERPEWIGERATVPVEEGRPVSIEKVVALRTSRDIGISEPVHDACLRVQGEGGFDELRRTHEVEWWALWRRFDLRLVPVKESSGPNGLPDEAARRQLILRLHLFHLLQTCSHNSVSVDAGVPARGWHGEAYRGHIFWDEVFILPLYNLHQPEIARSLLLYRYTRLDKARENARKEGFEGALFPWQSGSDGREETQVVHLNPRSGAWDPDRSRLQRHINAAVAYNVWQYFTATGDLQFLRRYGGEMLLEIARFWSSAATWNPERERWEIRGVMGPDEYQEAYPDREDGGVDNNAYTNVMAVWCIERALDTLDRVGEPRTSEIRERLEIGDEELKRFRSITERMFVPFLPDGVIEQFEGYRDLEEFDWEGYRDKYGDIQRLDRILKAEMDSPDRYKASKQADATMLFYLLPSDELEAIFGKLGYPFDWDTMVRTVDYYRKRTSHGSTLSRVVYASVLNLVDPEEGWELFQEALRSDIDDIQGGTTAEGIHLGAMAGTVDTVLRRYAGMQVTREEVAFDPCRPVRGVGMDFRVQHRMHWIHARFRPGELRLALEPTAPESIPVRVDGQRSRLEPGEPKTFSLPD